MAWTCEICGIKGDNGVGLFLKPNEKGELEIVRLAPGGSAYLSGQIQPGDVVYEVGGKNVYKKPFDVFLQHTQGTVGTYVQVKVYRNGDVNEARSVVLERTINPEDNRSSQITGSSPVICLWCWSAPALQRPKSPGGSAADITEKTRLEQQVSALEMQVSEERGKNLALQEQLSGALEDLCSVKDAHAEVMNVAHTTRLELQEAQLNLKQLLEVESKLQARLAEVLVEKGRGDIEIERLKKELEECKESFLQDHYGIDVREYLSTHFKAEYTPHYGKSDVAIPQLHTPVLIGRDFYTRSTAGLQANNKLIDDLQDAVIKLHSDGGAGRSEGEYATAMSKIRSELTFVIEASEQLQAIAHAASASDASMEGRGGQRSAAGSISSCDLGLSNSRRENGFLKLKENMFDSARSSAMKTVDTTGDATAAVTNTQGSILQNLSPMFDEELLRPLVTLDSELNRLQKERSASSRQRKVDLNHSSSIKSAFSSPSHQNFSSASRQARRDMQEKLNLLAAALSYSGLTVLSGFSAFDQDRDGRVSIEDLRMSMRDLEITIQHGELQILFNFLDADNDGFISETEWIMALRDADPFSVLVSSAVRNVAPQVEPPVPLGHGRVIVSHTCC
jgi:hypothetical protein